MSSKAQFRIKMALYGVVLILAELIQTAVFGELNLGMAPCIMPVAVSCIALFEGAERGGIFGLAGGCLWAWATALSMYGAYVIVILTIIGAAAGPPDGPVYHRRSPVPHGRPAGPDGGVYGRHSRGSADFPVPAAEPDGAGVLPGILRHCLANFPDRRTPWIEPFAFVSIWLWC